MKSVLRVLFAHYEAYHHDGLLLRYTSVLGVVMYPSFYLLRFTRPESVYDDLGLRVLATSMCLVVLVRAHWPRRLQRFCFDDFVARRGPACAWPRPQTKA
jgi:hypothetical protein